MKRLLYLLKRIPRIPRRFCRDFRTHLFPLPVAVRLWITNRFGRTQITAEGGPVVSMTTHGVRARRVYLAIESIARGCTLPSRMILWLDDRALFDNLPVSIRRLMQRGLEVKVCTNYGPHTKYFPYVASQEDFVVPLVTADDDTLYPRHWLAGLVRAYRESPNTVNCYWAEIIASRNGIRRRRNWQRCCSPDPTFRQVAFGFAGVIYPPAFLRALKMAGDSFKDCCPKADDLWLHVQELRAGYKIRQFVRAAHGLLQIPFTQKIGLRIENETGGNDTQAAATYTNEDLRIMLKD